MSDAHTRARVRTSSTVLNAFVGTAVMLIAAPLLAFSPVLGGGVAGFLQRGSLRDGARTGALAGLFAAIPTAFAAWVLGQWLLLGTLDLIHGPMVLVGIAFGVILGYTVLGAAGGGYLGAYLRESV